MYHLTEPALLYKSTMTPPLHHTGYFRNNPLLRQTGGGKLISRTINQPLSQQQSQGILKPQRGTKI
jgi:hypothetical protein